MTPDEHDDVEARLRDAIQARTSAVEPGPDALTRIEDRLMEAQRSSARQRGWLIGLTAAAAVIAVVVAVALVQDDDEEPTLAGPSSTTSSVDTTVDETTTTTTPVPEVDPAIPLWPVVASSQRFDDPVAAARSFAVDLVGFTDPVVGPFQQADNRSGEVEVKPRANGPSTLVVVRQLEDDTWFVIAAVTENITLETPEQQDQLSAGSFDVAGTALAFEGHVNVRLYEDGNPDAIGEGFVTGSGSPPAGPFEGSIEWSDPSTDFGVLVLQTESAEDGSIWEATAIRVRLRS